MTFVFPAILGALLAAGIPILLHLIQRQKPKTVRFPAFRFLVERQRSNQRRLQLRHWLLLALRMALLAGLVLAIARPRVLQRGLGLSSERPVAAVFVIDVSASMDARSSDDRTRLDDARARAAELIDKLPPGSRISVVGTGDAIAARADWVLNPTAAKQRLQSLKVQPGSPPLAHAVSAALRQLADLAGRRDDEVGQRLPRLLCVVSDTTSAAWPETQRTPIAEASDAVPALRDALVDARSDIPATLAWIAEAKGEFATLADALTSLRDAVPRWGPSSFPLVGDDLALLNRVRQGLREAIRARPDDAGPLPALLARLAGHLTLWIDVGLDARDVGIVRIERPLVGGELREWLAPDETLGLRVVVRAVGQDFQATLECDVGGAVQSRPVLAPKGTDVVVPFDVRADAVKTPFLPVEFRLAVRDAWAGNDRRFATFEIREPPLAWVVADRPLADDEPLVRALKANRLGVAVVAPAQVEAGVPPEVRLAFLLGVPAPSDGMWRSLDAFVRRGGGLAVAPGDPLDLDAYRTPAAKAVLPAEWKRIVRQNDAVLWNWRPASLRHPLLAPFDRWRLDPAIDFVKFPPRATTYWETLGKNPVISYADAGETPALWERAHGAGKVVQFTTALDLREPAWNNYLESIHSFYVVVVGLTAKHLAGESAAPRLDFVCGDEASVPARKLASAKSLAIRGPDAFDPVVAPPDAAAVPAPQAKLPGNFRVEDAGSKRPLAGFSVNLPESETLLDKLPKPAIESLFGGGAVVPSDRTADLASLLQGRWSEPVELYPFVMLALLVFLAFENLLANRFYPTKPRE